MVLAIIHVSQFIATGKSDASASININLASALVLFSLDDLGKQDNHGQISLNFSPELEFFQISF
jgi:hypothetical protein